MKRSLRFVSFGFFCFLLTKRNKIKKNPSNMLSLALFFMYWYFLCWFLVARFRGPFNVLFSSYFFFVLFPPHSLQSWNRWCEGLDKTLFLCRLILKRREREVSETRQEYQIKINRLLMYIGHIYGKKYPGYSLESPHPPLCHLSFQRNALFNLL